MTEDIEGGLSADKLARLFDDFGDFNIFKDSQSSFFMEFFYLELCTVPSQTVEEFISKVTAPELAKQLGIKAVVPYMEATKFKAHNRLEYWVYTLSKRERGREEGESCRDMSVFVYLLIEVR